MVSESRALLGMVLIRTLSACLEFSAAVLMLSWGSLRAAVRLNALLGLVGPAILLTATLVGVAGLAASAPHPRWLLVPVGVALVWLGTR